jgi:hypothetical protein
MTVAVAAGQWVPVSPPGDSVGCVAAWEQDGDLVVVAPKEGDRVLYQGPYRVLGRTRRAIVLAIEAGALVRLMTECVPCSQTSPAAAA